MYQKAKERLPKGFYFVGYSAFKLTRWVITPFRRTGALGPKRARFNKALSSARVIVENYFGRLKGRWERLQLLNFMFPSMPTIISAVVFLQNFVNHFGDKNLADEYFVDDEDSDSESDADSDDDDDDLDDPAECQLAKNKRADLARDFC